MTAYWNPFQIRSSHGTTYPSALRSELSLSGLTSLAHGSVLKLLLDTLPTLKHLQQRRPSIYNSSWLCPSCNSATEDLQHLWECPCNLTEYKPCSTHRILFRTFKTTLLDKFLHTPASTVLPQTFDLDFLSLKFGFVAPSFSMSGKNPKALLSLKNDL
ncbi:hypothetical protein RhiirA1_475774 [Rhizophagus irregularis]|uniref:Uncharacterized protein n=1 Tax=Rhizophagus irregularis TaxID=588596 RepID=A0A2N0QWA2_9GLOM|nr:hypothetical protein RhiirA1_475774 [Rhizophagus irregularis]